MDARQAYDELDEVIAPDFVGHDLPPGLPVGARGLRQFRETTRGAFPDAQTTIQQLLADGDYVIARFTIAGTHLGPLMGLPPTGKRFQLDLIEIARFRDGKIVERWTERDFLKLLQQLGLAPSGTGVTD
ncbi:MAG: ester cyclase [Chloroflexi bacterium]|nr:ester cyclase [Chloroflexota bacterium]